MIKFDIDQFKKINNTYGYAAGEELYQELYALIMEGVKSFDTVARYDGEEIVVVMTEIDVNVAITLAGQLRHGVENQPFTAATNDQKLKVTISIGVTEVGVTRGASTTSPVYRAKSGAVLECREALRTWPVEIRLKLLSESQMPSKKTAFPKRQQLRRIT